MPKYYTIGPNVMPDMEVAVFDMIDMMEAILPFAIKGARAEWEKASEAEQEELHDLIHRLMLVQEGLEERKEEQHGDKD